MKKIAIISLFIIVMALGIFPFFLSQATNDSLTIASNLISALASLFTLLIAVLLYTKYGVEKSILSKQTDVVLCLLSKLKKTNFLCTWSGGLLFLRLDSLQDKYWKDYKNKNLVFGLEYAKGLNNIWEITDNIFLPTEIVEKIKPLRVVVITEKKEIGTDMKVSVPGNFSEKEKDFFGLLNDKAMCMQEFVELWDSVIKTINTWLKNHSSVTIGLNFERK